MNDHGMNGEMHMNDYSFMGAHMYWWVAILVIILLLVLILQQYRKRR
jgi:disulfide bond formation protein DsbB